MTSARVAAESVRVNLALWRLLHAALVNAAVFMVFAFLLIFFHAPEPYLFVVSGLVTYVGNHLQLRWHDRLDAELKESP